MRTTLAIDDVLLDRLKQEAEREHTSLREMVDRVLRLGLERLAPKQAVSFRSIKVHSMGFPPIPNLDKALQLAALLEDEETARMLVLKK